MNDLDTMCICGGVAYECAHCDEKRCMQCDEHSRSVEVKTCVRFCPKHKHAGQLGLLENGTLCHGCGGRIEHGDAYSTFRISTTPGEWRYAIAHDRTECLSDKDFFVGGRFDVHTN